MYAGRTVATLFVACALAGQAPAQEAREIRGRSIPENSIERQIIEADLAAERQADLCAVTGAPASLEGKTASEEVWNFPLRRMKADEQGAIGIFAYWPHMHQTGTHHRTVAPGALVALLRGDTYPTKDQPLWVAIRNRFGEIWFDTYDSRDERGVARGCIGITANGREASFTWAEDGVGPKGRKQWDEGASQGERTAWWGICHGAAPARLADVFDSAMLAGSDNRQPDFIWVPGSRAASGEGDGADVVALIVPIAMDKGVRFLVVTVQEGDSTPDPNSQALDPENHNSSRSNRGTR